jgi:WD40 repeat protein
MPGTERVFRVFISSTFGDMVAERTVLQEQVFPRLQSFCRERGGRFQAIDLRWGVSDQAARDRRTMGICIEEIQRCRQVSPALNFLVLLGNRYGWRPIPAEIDAADFDRLREAATRGGRKILERAYRRDDNARPARYVLLAQQDEAESVENALRAAFVQALAAAFPEEDPRRIAYGASATHLEIAERLSHDPADARNVFCYMREAASRATLEQQSPDDREDLARLKVELESRLGSSQVRRYRLRTSRRRSDADAFAARIESDLRTVIEQELREHRRRPALDREIDEQRRFAVERARHVIGREDILARLRAYLSGNETHPLAIVGRSGSGKTSVMARAFLDSTTAEQHSGAVVISRFVGATPDTADIELLLRSICAELGRAYRDAQPPPMRYHELEKDFQRRLAAATRERPLHLFLDALDQIDVRDSGPLLPWLPRVLPTGVRLILSVLEADDDAGDRLKTMREVLPEEAFVPLAPIEATDAARILDVWLEEAKRTLQPAQRVAVLDAYRRGPLPLLLRVAFEQARPWRSFDPPTPLAGDVEKLAGQFYGRLEAPGQHGSILVRSSLQYLCAARFGLTEDELLALLSANPAVVSELIAASPHSPRVSFVPFVVWSRLRSDLAPYMADHAADDTSVMTFYHRALRVAAVAMSTPSPEAAATAHGHLAAFFAGDVGTPQPHRFSQPGSTATVPNRRKLSELPYQQTGARLWPELTGTLTDLSFIQAKCAAEATGDLVADYDRVLRQAQDERASARKELSSVPVEHAATLAEFRRFVQRERSTFEAFPRIDGLVLQQARNQGRFPAVAQAWSRLAKSAKGGSWRGRRWLRIDRPHDADDPLLAALRRHTRGVTDCAFDGAGSLLITSGIDGAVLAWQSSDWGFVEVVAELPASADSCTVSADGTRVATACADGSVRIHDRRTRATTVCEGKYAAHPRRCRFARGDELLVSVGRFGLKVHETATGRLVREILPESTMNDCAIGPGTLVTAGDCDSTFFVVDLADGSVVHKAYLDVRRIQGAAYSPDGTLLLATGGTFSVEDDMQPFGQSQLWDTRTWAKVGHRHRHEKPALNGAFVDEGRAYAIGLQDGTIEIFDTATGDLVNRFKQHDNGVRGLTLSPDGACLATGSFDGSAKIWRTSALVSGRSAMPSNGQGLFCGLTANGDAGWAVTASVDRFHADFSIQQLSFGKQVPPPVRVPRSRALQTLRFDRRDPSMPMEACELTLRAVHSPSMHRTSPVPGDGDYWLVHHSARMSPSEFHLLPAIAADRQSRDNRTWTRSPDGRRTAILRTTLTASEGRAARHVALLLFDGPRAKQPSRTCEWDVELQRTFGQCSYALDGRSVRVAVGSEVWEISTQGRQAARTLAGAGAEIVAFSESPAGATLAAACADGTLCAWDLSTGEVRGTYAGHHGRAVDCAFVAADELVSIGADGTLRLWSIAGDEPLAVFVADTALAALATSPARGRILAVDTNGRPYFLEMMRGRRR